jgi:hypothetical protein
MALLQLAIGILLTNHCTIAVLFALSAAFLRLTAIIALCVIVIRDGIAAIVLPAKIVISGSILSILLSFLRKIRVTSSSYYLTVIENTMFMAIL